MADSGGANGIIVADDLAESDMTVAEAVATDDAEFVVVDFDARRDGNRALGEF